MQMNNWLLNNIDLIGNASTYICDFVRKHFFADEKDHKNSMKIHWVNSNPSEAEIKSALFEAVINTLPFISAVLPNIIQQRAHNGAACINLQTNFEQADDTIDALSSCNNEKTQKIFTVLVKAHNRRLANNQHASLQKINTAEANGFGDLGDKYTWVAGHERTMAV